MTKKQDIVPIGEVVLSIKEKDVAPLLARCLSSVREEMRENAYIIEALKVLPVGGYRSAIGSFWNAVVDDLRNKIIARSLSMFNKSLKLRRDIKTYEDFQEYVNDDELIEGAYKIGVIGWEASKVLRHAKETRHIFDGHPKSSDPSVIKVLAMMDDCIKYVLNVDCPISIIDIDDYISNLGDENFDRNETGVENALGDLPEIYKNELINRLYTTYIREDTPSTLRSNIEFILPILWNVLTKDIKIQVVRRIDQAIAEGNSLIIKNAFDFVIRVNGTRYLTQSTRKYKIEPLVLSLKENLDNWKEENNIVNELQYYCNIIPNHILQDYVSAITHTYVGYMGHSGQWARSDFYANGAVLKIPPMVKAFDDNAAGAFVQCVKSSRILRSRIEHPQKLQRLRNLCNIVLERISDSFGEKAFLDILADEDREEEFWKQLPILEK